MSSWERGDGDFEMVSDLGTLRRAQLPGADVNPYPALSAMVATGLHGLDREAP
jgi:hypothetical protein